MFACKTLAALAVLAAGAAGQDVTAAAARTALDRYLARSFPEPAPVQTADRRVGEGRVRLYRFVSQKWQGFEWTHRLLLARGKRLDREKTCLLMITGSSAGDRQTRWALRVAAKLRARVAVLFDVPNQPLRLPGDESGRAEDDLLAETLLRYAKTGDETWPLLFPMTRAAHAAMAVVRDLVPEVEGFVVTGASKRGWTTFLTGATAGKLVLGIAPAVFDNLRFKEQMDLQLGCYARYSSRLVAYYSRRLMGLFDTERGHRIVAWVDPWSYRNRLVMPKLLVLGTNDPYWTATSASLYAGALPGTTLIHYEPNVGHGALARGGSEEAVVTFFDAVAGGDPLPAPVEAGAPDAELWIARSQTRDFRRARWTTGKERHGGKFEARMWRRRVGVAGGGEIEISTPIVVVPVAR